MHKSNDEVAGLRRRIKKKLVGKVWNLRADCTNESEISFTLSENDKDIFGGDTSPEFLAFLTLVTIGSAVNFMKDGEANPKKKSAAIGVALASVGNVLVKAWDDLEKERAVFLN